MAGGLRLLTRGMTIADTQGLVCLVSVHLLRVASISRENCELIFTVVDDLHVEGFGRNSADVCNSP